MNCPEIHLGERCFSRIPPLLQPNDVRPEAFAKREALMPMWGMQPVDSAEWPSIWQRLQQSTLMPGALAYVHIPFCANHCVYCGFYRNLWREERGAPYVRRLAQEFAAETVLAVAAAPIEALYFGGGTPTALAGSELAGLLQAARHNLPLSADCEITIEGRISHFDLDKLDACLKAGANRFSIGVQSFDGELRQRLGRQHAGDEAAEYLRRLCRHTNAVIVADLMFGLPGQDDAMWAHDLDVALSLGLSGLDIYAFNCFPRLPINRMIEKGNLPAIPGLATQARQYAYAVRRLQAEGWRQVSNSHFARPGGGERNRYNSAIKSGRDCLAFGSGAGGCRDGYSYQVEGDLARYLASPASEKPLGMLAAVSPFKQSFGQLQGALEDGYLPLALLAGHDLARERIEHWQQQGLLGCDGPVANLTIAGRFWAPMLIRELALMISTSKELLCPQSPHLPIVQN